MTNDNREQTESLNIREYVSTCLRHWKWFVASIVICVSIAITYLIATPPQFERTMQLMIKNNNPSGNITAGLSAMQSLGFIGGSSNVNNELAAMLTPSVMMTVVKQLGLDYNYTTREFLIRETPLYAETLPVTVTVKGLTDDDKAMFTMELDHGKLTISDLKKNKEDFDGVLKGEVNKPIKSAIGTITVTPTPYYTGDEEITIDVLRRQPYEQAEEQLKKLNAGVDNELTEVISLTYLDASVERATDILNTMVNVYNMDWMRDKNDLANATVKFIDSRLKVIEEELGIVEEDISKYKSQNRLPDIVEAAKLYMAKSDQNKDMLVQLNNQMYMASYVRDYLKDNSNKNELLPANLIINDQNIEQQIVDYNNLQLQRNRIVMESSENNPMVINLDKQLKSMRMAVLATIDNVVKQLQIQIKGLEKSESDNENWIETSPVKAKHLLSAERQQKVSETIFIFLLQKREESVLSQAFEAYNTRVLSAPYGKHRPVAPRRLVITASSLLAGGLLPAIFIFVRLYFREEE